MAVQTEQGLCGHLTVSHSRTRRGLSSLQRTSPCLLVTTHPSVDSSAGPRNSRLEITGGPLHTGQGQPHSMLTATTDKGEGGTGQALEHSLQPGLGFMFYNKQMVLRKLSKKAESDVGVT